MGRRIARSNRQQDPGTYLGAEPQRERVGSSVVANREERLCFLRGLCLFERDALRVRRPESARVGAFVSCGKVAKGAGIQDLVDGLLDEVVEPQTVWVVVQDTLRSLRDTGRAPVRSMP